MSSPAPPPDVPPPAPPRRGNPLVRHLVLGLLLAGVFAVVGVVLVPSPKGDAPKASVAVPLGTVVDFTLDKPAPLSLASLRGQVVLLYFGYTSCPDVCPTSLTALAAGLAQLSEAELAQVTPVFVSVDPERDVPSRLTEYATFFHPRFRAATGTPAQVAAAAKPFGVVYHKVYAARGGGDYSVDHSALTYVIDPAGRLVEKLPHGAPAADVAAAVRRHLPPPAAL